MAVGRKADSHLQCWEVVPRYQGVSPQALLRVLGQPVSGRRSGWVPEQPT